MTVEALLGPPALPASRVAEEITAALGPMPWLTATGRLEQILRAWGREQLAEVPAGLAFDVLRTTGPLAHDTIVRMRAAGRRTGPVVLGANGAEFIIERGSAPDWNAPRSGLLRPGTLVLLPPPHVCIPDAVAARGWLVPPCHPETGAAVCAEVTPGRALREPYLAAVEAAVGEELQRCAA
ncbi:hypothetical protein ACFRI7_31705 [Streptomyces sp. NPDC056716]|uniref:hypothetical protein n=1 Tax=unclassified Streptomyces TaxID=2593676 RepID=UPI0036B07DEB